MISDNQKKSMNAEIILIQSNVVECFNQDYKRTIIKANNGHVTPLCGVYGKIGDSFNVFWQEGKGISLN